MDTFISYFLVNPVFYVFATAAVLLAVLMLTIENPVYSAIFLVLTFFCIAVVYVTLEAEFIAAIQVLVYTGAIMVLFLFVIMLLNLGRQDTALRRTPTWFVAVLLAGVLASQLVPSLVGYSPERLALEYTRSTVLADPRMVFDSTLGAAQATLERGVPGDIAQPLFAQYLVPFELTSILLLAAIVGAVVLAKRRI